MLSMNYQVTVLLPVIIAFVACEDSNNAGSTTWDGVCQDNRDGWEKCSQNRIQWCHVLEGMTPHFHEGLDCDALGLTCVEFQVTTNGATVWAASCVDSTQTCTDGEFKCEENSAMNCLNKAMAIEPCGTKTCHEDTALAHCEEGEEECGGHGHLDGDECLCDENYEIDKEDATNCIATMSFPELVCADFNAGKDSIDTDHQLDATDTFPGPHAHLDEVMSINLLADNNPNYMHFPVTVTGEYFLFLDTADVVTNFYVKAGEKVPSTKAGPNGFCKDDLVDHFHISATYTGDGTSPVPTIVELNVEQDMEVRFLVKFHEDEENAE